MLKLRPAPLLLTVVIAGGLLFGGWFAYRQMAVEQPLEHALASVEGVAQARHAVSRGEVTVELELERDADLQRIYHEIRTETAVAVGSRELTIDIAQPDDEELDRIWSTVLFEVAEAMETREYGKIPAAAEQLMQTNEGLTMETGIDEINVYLTMRKGDAVKYIVLPRVPRTMGVWPHV